MRNQVINFNQLDFLKSITFIFSILLTFCWDVQTNYYKTLSDAKENGLIKRGWIPAILPPSSRNIYEQHDIDTNEVWMRFHADKEDLIKLRGKLRKLDDNEIKNVFPSKKLPGWWFQKRRQNINCLAAYEYSIKMSDGKLINLIGYFFFNINNSLGYYYSPGF